jgi:hypothetical protein
VSAVAYAALVGRYIRMERPATEAELAEAPDMHTIGMECTVAAVRDVRDELGLDVVEVLADYGYGFTVRAGERWSFTEWPDEAAARELRLP